MAVEIVFDLDIRRFRWWCKRLDKADSALRVARAEREAEEMSAQSYKDNELWEVDHIPPPSPEEMHRLIIAEAEAESRYRYELIRIVAIWTAAAVLLAGALKIAV